MARITSKQLRREVISPPGDLLERLRSYANRLEKLEDNGLEFLPMNMSHSDVLKQITEYVDGKLEPRIKGAEIGGTTFKRSYYNEKQKGVDSK